METTNKKLYFTDLKTCVNQAIAYKAAYIGIKIKYPNLIEPKIEIYSAPDFDTILDTYRNMYNDDLTYIVCEEIEIIGFEYGYSFAEIGDWLNDIN